MTRPQVSVVVPVYRCESTLRELYQRLVAVFVAEGLSFELLLVNDASPQDDWKIIEKLAEEDQRVKGINFTRNFGQVFATSAGIDHADGDWVVLMDGDLEDRPEDILPLFREAQKGFDIVYGLYDGKGNRSWFMHATSRLYHVIYNFLSDLPYEDLNARFVIFSRPVADRFRRFHDRRRQILPILLRVGYRFSTVRLRPQKIENQSSYTLAKKFEVALAGIVSHSTILLRMGIYVGMTFSVISLSYGAFVIARKLLGYEVELGWSSLITSIFLVGGLLMVIMGILGLYIETILYEVKRHPLYLVRDRLNLVQNKLRDEEER